MAAAPAAIDSGSNDAPFIGAGNELAPESANCSSGLQAALDSYGWVVHVGPVSVGRDGIDIRPQLKFGGQIGNVSAQVGVGDVRDGLQFESGVKAFAEAEGSGRSLEELHADVRRRLGDKASSLGSAVGAAASSEKVDRALEAAGRILSSSARGLGSRTGEIATALGVDTADLDSMLAGQAGGNEAAGTGEQGGGPRGVEHPPMTLKVRASTGLNVSCQMCLGWCDTNGYHMMGLGAKAVAFLAAGGNLFAGRHTSGVGIKIVLGIGNFTLEYTFPVAKMRQKDAASAAAGSSPGLQAQQQSAGPAGADAAGLGASVASPPHAAAQAEA